jgi:hypothetical protein
MKGADGAISLSAAALLAALCAAGTVRGEAETLEKGSTADASLEERLKSKARPVPGTGMRYIIAGYVQLDALWTRRELVGDEKEAFLPSAIPFGAADSDTRLSFRASQVNVILQGPTSLGELTAIAQADLYAYEKGAQPNLTQLAVRLGEWLVVGKTYSTFMDADGWPSTLDYNGPSGAVFVRQTVLRGSVPLGDRLRLAAALEDPQTDAKAESSGFSVSASADRPDFVARLRYGGERLRADVAALSRSVTYSAQLPSGSSQRRISGSGVSASAVLQVGSDDRILLQWTRGQGIARYFNDGLSGLGAVYDSGGNLAPLKLTGGYLYYERQWAARWTSAAGVSALRADSEGLRPASDLRRVDYASANLVHRLAADLFAGGEVLWGRAERMDGTRANDTRIQLSVRYYLY